MLLVDLLDFTQNFGLIQAWSKSFSEILDFGTISRFSLIFFDWAIDGDRRTAAHCITHQSRQISERRSGQGHWQDVTWYVCWRHSVRNIRYSTRSHVTTRTCRKFVTSDDAVHSIYPHTLASINGQGQKWELLIEWPLTREGDSMIQRPVACRTPICHVMWAPLSASEKPATVVFDDDESGSERLR